MITILFAYYFYRSALAVLFLAPIFQKVAFYLDEICYKKKENILKNQFREMILSVATNLKVGYSVENAFLEVYADLIRLYGKKSRIVYELELIKKGLAVNMTLEKGLKDFSNRCNIEEITEFVDIFIIARKMGGNLTDIIQTTVDMISQKIEVDNEIHILISAKRLEQQIMMCVPFLIISYIEITNRNFFLPLYHNMAGVFVMSVCLLIYLVSIKISAKVMDIRI